MFLGITGLEIIFVGILLIAVFLAAAIGISLHLFSKNKYIGIFIVTLIITSIYGVLVEALLVISILALIGGVITGLMALTRFLLTSSRQLIDSYKRHQKENQIKRQRRKFISSDAKQWLAAQHIPVMDTEKVHSYMYTMVKRGNRLYPTQALNKEMNLFISSELQIKEELGELNLQIHRLEILRCQIATQLKTYFELDEENKCLIKPNR